MYSVKTVHKRPRPVTTLAFNTIIPDIKSIFIFFFSIISIRKESDPILLHCKLSIVLLMN